MSALYAGFDCSTQSLSLVVIDAGRQTVVLRDSLPFAEPFTRSPDGRVHAEPIAWRGALAIMLERLSRDVDGERLRAISGAAQQHGSVYCADTPDDLTRPSAPIWLDSSTSRECEEIERALGGPVAVARLTGSRAFPRFTAAQIRKFHREDPSAYARTRRVHLVSSYLASVLIGEHAPLDHADASGMNLMDIRTFEWSAAAMDATAPGLALRLPGLVPSRTVIGTLAATWRERLRLPAVKVVAWTGDNPSSLVGTGLLNDGQLTISLGTSDTVFGPMRTPEISERGTGHVFASPLGGYMGITVFSNGSLARERIRDAFGLTWDGFSAALRATPPGNGGAMMLPWFEPEISPAVPAPGAMTVGLDGSGPAAHVRAVVEGQALAMARHSAWMGVAPREIHATGGAAANREILQVLADVFNARVLRFEATDAAALGAALRAYEADSGRPWRDVLAGFVEPLAEAVRPDARHAGVYTALRREYAAREADALLARGAPRQDHPE